MATSDPDSQESANSSGVLTPREPASAETYLELAKMSQESIFNRRSTEWKVAFGLWTAIGLITYFAVEQSHGISMGILVGFGFLYLLILVVWFFGWQVPLHRAFKHDKAFKHYYMHKAEGRCADWPAEMLATYGDVIFGIKDWGWNYGQTAVTAVFLLGSFLVIFSVAGKTNQDNQLEFKASGGTITIQAEPTKKASKTGLMPPAAPVTLDPDE